MQTKHLLLPRGVLFYNHPILPYCSQGYFLSALIETAMAAEVVVLQEEALEEVRTLFIIQDGFGCTYCYSSERKPEKSKLFLPVSGQYLLREAKTV